MISALARRLVHLETEAAARGEFQHLTMAQLQDLIAAVEQQIAADAADVADDRA